MFMALNLPSDIAIKGVTFGTPRVGNSAWAALFDATVCIFTVTVSKQLKDTSSLYIDLRL